MLSADVCAPVSARQATNAAIVEILIIASVSRVRAFVPHHIDLGQPIQILFSVWLCRREFPARFGLSVICARDARTTICPGSPFASGSASHARSDPLPLLLPLPDGPRIIAREKEREKERERERERESSSTLRAGHRHNTAARRAVSTPPCSPARGPSRGLDTVEQ